MKFFIALSALLAVAAASVVRGPVHPANGPFVATRHGVRNVALEGFSEDDNQDGFVDPIGQVAYAHHIAAPAVYHHGAPAVYHQAPVVVAAPAVHTYAAAPVVTDVAAAPAVTHVAAPAVHAYAAAPAVTHVAAPAVHAYAAPAIHHTYAAAPAIHAYSVPTATRHVTYSAHAPVTHTSTHLVGHNVATYHHGYVNGALASPVVVAAPVEAKPVVVES